MSKPEPMPPVAILAGGLGTRLGDLTHSLPKALLPVAGQPFIAHQLRLLHREGVERVVVCAGHMAEQIKDFLGRGDEFGLRVDFSLDGPKLLGTGGALRKALPLLGEDFAFLYGDSYLDEPLAPIARAFRRSGRLGLMSVLRNGDRWDKSNANFADGKVARYDKKDAAGLTYIDFGFNLLQSRALAAFPAGDPFDIADLLADLASRGELAGYEVGQRFYEIGSPAGLMETESYLREVDSVRRQ
jgi:NDP-sugar pyrophosphorylase family protein